MATVEWRVASGSTRRPFSQWLAYQYPDSTGASGSEFPESLSFTGPEFNSRIIDISTREFGSKT